MHSHSSSQLINLGLRIMLTIKYLFSNSEQLKKRSNIIKNMLSDKFHYLVSTIANALFARGLVKRIKQKHDIACSRIEFIDG
jgi:hypothetical protein